MDKRVYGRMNVRGPRDTLLVDKSQTRRKRRSREKEAVAKVMEKNKMSPPFTRSRDAESETLRRLCSCEWREFNERSLLSFNILASI